MIPPYHFDLVVVGAGPAGAMAAREAASAGRLVCLLERKSKAGTPVRCGEGIGLKGAASNGFAVEDHWIKAKISRVRLVSPNAGAVELRRGADSVIVDREVMDSDLVQQAVEAGARYFPDTPVISVSRAGEKLYECKSAPPRSRLLSFSQGEGPGPAQRPRTFTAPCVILADGVESRLARGLGWKTALAPEDVDSCAFCRIGHPSIENDVCIFYVGNAVTPAGYAWVFPRGDHSANAGLGVLGSHSRPGGARQLLERFIETRFPGASISHLHCGGVPAGRWLKPLVRDGVMVAGDAARQVLSLTGAGINYSLYAGKLAGRVAAEAFGANGIDYRRLLRYEKIWASDLGRQQMRSYALKTLLVRKHDDGFLDAIASSLSRKNRGKLNILGVFLRTFASNPLALARAFLLFR